MTEKTCGTCRQCKPLSAFYVKKNRGKPVVCSRCKECEKVAAMAWQAAHPQQARDTNSRAVKKYYAESSKASALRARQLAAFREKLIDPAALDAWRADYAERNQRSAVELDDRYVLTAIVGRSGISRSAIPAGLVEAKRQQLQQRRSINELERILKEKDHEE